MTPHKGSDIPQHNGSICAFNKGMALLTSTMLFIFLPLPRDVKAICNESFFMAVLIGR